ncbi:hypothetical protein [Vibrio splendidus]|uniref:hypothetical protein n=1 Tax=Vibrio splendidus TaxID=29497 RepID=UPI003D0F1EAC
MATMTSNESVLNELISLGSLIDLEPSSEVEFYANFVMPKEYLRFDWSSSPTHSSGERKTRYSLELRRQSRYHKGLFSHIDGFNGADTKYARGLTKLINHYIILAVGYLINKEVNSNEEQNGSCIVAALEQISDSLSRLALSPISQPPEEPSLSVETSKSETPSDDLSSFDMNSLLP